MSQASMRKFRARLAKLERAAREEAERRVRQAAGVGASVETWVRAALKDARRHPLVYDQERNGPNAPWLLGEEEFRWPEAYHKRKK